MKLQENRYLDRDFSWLKFNERVLYEALSPKTPLLERLGYLQIFNSNLDEFFMKRVGGLKRQILAKVHQTGHTGITPKEKLSIIRKELLPLFHKQAQCFQKDIQNELTQSGIDLVPYLELSKTEKIFLQDFFMQSVFPVLTPLAVDPGHPFPFISNLSASFGVLMKNPKLDGEELFARIKVPQIYPVWIQLPTDAKTSRLRFSSLYELIGFNLHLLFPGMEILDVMMFRVTRNADLEKDAEDAEDLLEMVAEELKERRFAKVVRVEHGPKKNAKILAILEDELDLQADDIYELPMMLEFYALKKLSEIPMHDLRFPAWLPIIPIPFSDPETSPFDIIKNKDVLVHHPYESFNASIEKFIKVSVDDKKVLAIKMTLYRMGDDSPFLPLLIRAAESGKQVVCLVELKARFDEARNILVAQSLEKAGVHVVYGVMGLKTHSKLALVIRQDADRVRSYVHIGTGNYNAKTANLYTDLGLFSCNPLLTDDVVHLFHFLTGRSLEWNFKKILIAPIDMRASFLRMIEREIQHAKDSNDGRIIAKMNSLEDKEIIDALYLASNAGVQIDLVVRGVCCLQPGIKNLSENIRVLSIIGRFLEHSRIYYFKNKAKNPEEGEFFIGSADWMSRNLNERVEAIAPVEDVENKKKLWKIIEIMLQDKKQSWQMKGSGEYTKIKSKDSDSQVGSQELLMEQTKKGMI